MLPLLLQSPDEITVDVARRVRALRREQRWTQAELAARAGITLATYRRFERTGRIAFERLVRVALVLDALDGFDRLFALPPAASLDELESRIAGDARGRRRDHA